MVHFQSLDPAGANGARQVYLTSSTFHMPVDNPSAVTTFTPENLCVRQGGAVAFNTIGGFKWGGSLGAPTIDSQYHKGTPWQIFAATTGAATAWYSKDEGTKNGHVLTPAGGHDAREGHGTVEGNRELLMQVVVATGDDRSQSCGGPRRHPDGTLVDTSPAKSYMKVAGSGGGVQQPYVTKDRRFSTGVYCGGPVECAGSATMVWKGKTIATKAFTVGAGKSGKIPMRLSKAAFSALSKSKKLAVSYTMTTPFGTFTTPLTLKR
jgi:hypothetical protein